MNNTSDTLSKLKIRRTDMPNECEKVAKLRADFESHLDCYKERELRQNITHENNMKAIGDLTKAVQPLVDGITVLVVLQKLFKWLSGFAFLGVILSWASGYNPFK